MRITRNFRRALAHLLICALCVIAVIIAARIDDTYVGKKD